MRGKEQDPGIKIATLSGTITVRDVGGNHGIDPVTVEEIERAVQDAVAKVYAGRQVKVTTSLVRTDR